MDKTSNNKNSFEFYDVVIAGGGLAGIISSILLSKNGFKILLLEKKNYPFHKVCGEYISNEVLSFLNQLGFNPFDFKASRINKLRISDPSGKNIFVDLDPGGFGLSRYTMDHQLVTLAKNSGVNVLENHRVTNIDFDDNIFSVSTSDKKFQSDFVIGSYGKRDLLDKKLKRKFMNRHTGYMGVKYHIRIPYPANEIGLDNFPGGYCGIVKIEDDKYNLCYLYRRKSTDDFKNIKDLEEKILFRNPMIREVFNKATFMDDFPEVINEISFGKKSCVENHILLCGDSAGLITPLCGNGMAMAIHGAKILSETLTNNFSPGEKVSASQRNLIEIKYAQSWRKIFSSRLFWGRNLQSISGNSFITSSALKIIHSMPQFEKWLINKTHGKEISL